MHTTTCDDAVERRANRRHFPFFFIVVLLLIVSSASYYALHPRGPTYEGKNSAEWFREFQKASGNYWTVPASNPSLPPGVRVLDDRALRRDPAARALCALGTNAALYLGQEYARKDGALKVSYRNLYGLMPVSLSKFLPEPAAPRRLVRMDIVWALQAMENNTSPAVPGLLSVLPTADTSTLFSTVGILQKIPFDRHLLEPILDNWSRAAQYSNVVIAIDYLPAHSPVAARSLARVVASNDLLLRRRALNQLEKFGPTAVAALPELIAALTDADDEVRYAAARALVAIGPEAAPAIPALSRATNDASGMVQRASTRALRAIQGEQQD